METLTIDGVISNNIGLLYFDPSSETLKELDSTATYLTCKSHSFTIKRYYLTGSLLDYTSTIRITVNTSDLELYTCKIIKGDKVSLLSDFDIATNELNISSVDLGVYYTNVVPVDILIKSNTTTEKVIQLEIELLGNLVE